MNILMSEFDFGVISEQLPYPLDYKFQEFGREFTKFDEGVGSSNFAFLIASLNSLALRWISAIAIQEYMYWKAPDTQANAFILRSLKTPSDGIWKQVFEKILSTSWSKSSLEHMLFSKEILRKLKVKKTKKKNKKGGKGHSLQKIQELIQFRNQLLHGGEVFSEDEIYKASEKVIQIYTSLTVLDRCDWHVVVDGDEAKPYLRYKGHHFSLSPMLSFSPLFANELFFFNGYQEETIDFVSYRFSGHFSDTDIAFEPKHFFSFLRQFSVPIIPREALLDFSDLAAFHSRHFVGRTFILKQLFNYLSSGKEHYGRVRALAGMGKTALFAQMYTKFFKDKGWPSGVFPVWHFCSTSGGRDHSIVFLRSVLAQLDSHFGVLQGKECPMHLDALLELFKNSILEVSKCLKENERCVFILDALDESVTSLSTSDRFSIPSILPHPEDLPDGLFILLSYRVNSSLKNERVEQLLSVPHRFIEDIEGCSPLSGLTFSEVCESIDHALPNIDIPYATLNAVWNTATHDVSTPKESDRLADPFVMRFIVEGLQDGTINPKRGETVPKSLSALFDLFWNGLSTSDSFLLHRLLGMLAIMPDLGSDPFFSELFTDPQRSFSDDDIAERRMSINKLLVFTDSHYQLFHDRFREYVLRRFRHSEIVHVLHYPVLEFIRNRPLRNRAYGYRHMFYHLKELYMLQASSGQGSVTIRDEIIQLIWDDTYFYNKFKVLQQTDALLQDFRYAFSIFTPHSSTPSEDPWRSVGVLFHLAQRAHEVVGYAFEQSQLTLAQYARAGDAEQIIRILSWVTSPYRVFLHLLLASVWMFESGFEPTALFSAMLEIDALEIQPDELPFVTHLLETSRAPSELLQFVCNSVSRISS